MVMAGVALVFGDSASPTRLELEGRPIAARNLGNAWPGGAVLRFEVNGDVQTFRRTICCVTFTRCRRRGSETRHYARGRTTV